MKFFSWLASRPKKVVNYGKSIVGTEDLKKNAEFISDMAQSIAGKTDTKRSETFENAYTRLGLTEEDLAKSYKYYEIRFNIFIAFAALAILLLIYSLVVSKILSAFAILAFMAVCLSQLFTSSFRMYQIRRRELVSVKEWAQHKEEWWPRTFEVQRRSSSTALQPVSKSKKPPLKK